MYSPRETSDTVTIVIPQYLQNNTQISLQTSVLKRPPKSLFWDMTKMNLSGTSNTSCISDFMLCTNINILGSVSIFVISHTDEEASGI